MKKGISALIVLAFAAILLTDNAGVQYVYYDPNPQPSYNLLGGLLLASPTFGLFYVFYCFVKWQSRFHRRMRGDK